jgi:glutamate dehydrogenase
VKRHFREIGRDIQTDAFTCVGVGDMSGDVFGNGMLLSQQTRLVAAFNHLHIFIDPEPSTEEAWHERKRLFDLPGSTWADYDRKLLSEGGDIFERTTKQLTVSRQVVDRFLLESETLTPAELMQAMLRARVDLLWFGGIGTYVKASEESHIEVGDRANDEIRVNAEDLTCLVVGEGANLGVTQRGRIQFAMSAGRINTDFIDNSGGVDCSDHEVNIKIVLRDAVASGGLEGEARDQLLVDMTEEVSRLVLRDNYLQTQSISLVESQGMMLIDEHARLMRNLERQGRLDRRMEFLPDDSTLEERKQRKVGLTRPEIAVLLAYSKIALFNDLLESDMPEDGALVQDLVRYFPAPMRKKLRWHIERHRLRREIIATHVTNSIVNRVGPTFITRIAEETGRKPSDIARAYTAARDIFELRSVWKAIEALDNRIDSRHQIRMLLLTVNLVGTVIRWFLRYGGRPFDVGACTKRYESDIVVVAAQLEDLLPPAARKRVQTRHQRWLELGVPEELAARISTLDIMPSACDVARAAQMSEGQVDRVGKIYFNVGERFGIDSLRRAAEHMATDSAYAQAAITATLDDLAVHQAEITRQVVQYPGGAKKAIGSWIDSRKDSFERLEGLRTDFETAAHIDLAMLAIAERELRRLVELE